VDVDPDPLRQFGAWFEEARAAVPAPEVAVLATATADGRPSARMVLVKRADDDGFVLYTNLESRKAAELEENAAAALLFHWAELGRQVRVEGRAERIAAGEAAAYFATRPLGSRLGAWASPQSRPLPDRAELERRLRDARERWGDDPPLPPHWGGYRIVPEAWEFWRHGADRLHHRVHYVRAGDGWRRELLAP
jgi:pyridoxamine 5'-phosphate oxidase